MVLLMIILLSFCAIYFTRLLYSGKMPVAAIFVVVLYIYMVAWIYSIFVIDIADLGFSDTESRLSLLHGSIIYHSFVDITAKASVIPLGILESFVVILSVAVVAGLIVAFHGIFEITKYVLSKCHHIKLFSFSKRNKTGHSYYHNGYSSYCILRLHCRMNC